MFLLKLFQNSIETAYRNSGRAPPASPFIQAQAPAPAQAPARIGGAGAGAIIPLPRVRYGFLPEFKVPIILQAPLVGWVAGSPLEVSYM